MLKSLFFRTLLLLPVAAIPAMAQGTTHLNVPAKQIVYITFTKGTGDGSGQMSGMYMQRGDGSWAGSSIPSGQALIIRELSVTTNYGSSASPFQVAMSLSMVDASNQWYYGSLRDTYTLPANVYSYQYHFQSEVGLVVAGTLKPKISVAPSNGPFPISTWDSFSVQGWGYLTTF